MKNFTKWVISLTAIFMVSQATASHLSERLLLSARLNGMQEVPMVTTNGTGVAGFHFSSMRDSLFVNIAVNGLTGVIDGIHIHEGMVGENGPVVLDLGSFVVGNRVSTVFTNLSDEMISSFLSGNYYLNVHTAMYPAGEIRGQIILEADHLMIADLDGNQEVPAVITSAIGKGTFVLAKDLSDLKIRIVVNGLSGPIMGAHIHEGAMGENGGVIADLSDFIDGSTIMATIDPSDILTQLMNGTAYINVHTEMNEAGEIRGQIMLENVLGFDAWLDGSQEVPAFATPGLGLLSVKIPNTLDEIWYDCVFTNLTGGMAEGAHFHEASVGVNGPVLIDLTDDIMMNRISGVITGAAVTPELINKFLEGNIYLNIHNESNGGNGEIRGQVYRLAREGYTISLDGEQEVPSYNTPAKGAGVVSIDRDQTNAHYMVVVSGLQEMAEGAHFHNNVFGENGDVIYDLDESLVAMDGDASLFGYWREGFNSQQSIRFRNDSVYVNVHTASNGGAGEVRGQVLRDAGEYLVTGIEEELSNEAGSFSIFPNPAQDVVFISTSTESSAKSIMIIDQTGRICRTWNSLKISGAPYSIDISGMNPGVYQIVVSDMQTLNTQTLIVR